MAYKNAMDLLPAELLLEVQKYLSGELIYIPMKKTKKKAWGENSGIKLELKQRNESIRKEFQLGITIEQLSSIYCLSFETIKKIVYSHK